MATASQYAAAKKAATAYQAAKKSWNTAAAKKVYSSAASSLGVSWSSASKIYKSNTWGSGTSGWSYSSSWYKAPTTTATNKTVSTPTPTYTAPKTTAPTTSSYWDVRVWDAGRNQYTWTGVWLSGGASMGDVSKFSGLGWIQNFDKFGKSAELAEQSTPWFLAKRNDAYAMDILKNNADFRNVDDFTQKEIIRDYIKNRDSQWELQTGWRGEEDVINTVAALQARIGQTPADDRSDEQRYMDEAAANAEAWLSRDLDHLDSQYEAERSEFMRAWAVEDRYTNFNDVSNNINETMRVAWEHRAANWYTGTPTDEQIVEIANSTGNDFATTKKILEWRWWEALEMEKWFKDENEQWYNRQIENYELTRDRSIEDANTQHARTQEQLNRSIDDTMRQMERNVAMWEKAWALSGAVRSSGYMQGLENIRTDALRNVDRLETKKDWDDTDTAQYKARVSEEFNINSTRAKEDLDKYMNEVKTQTGGELNKYLLEYSPTSTELQRKIEDLQEKYYVATNATIESYQQNMRDAVDTMTYGTEKVLAMQQMKQDLQQTTVSNMLANNWAALAWISYDQLWTLLTDWEISSADYMSMVGNMKTLWISTLQSMWVPTPQDLQLYNQMLESGMTPQQSITAVTSANPTRFTQAADTGSEWKLNANTWEYYRTDAGGGLETKTNAEMNNAAGWFWSSPITTKIWTNDWDVDVEMWQQIESPVAGTITTLETHSDGNVSMEITTADGSRVELNHLDPSVMQYKDQLLNSEIWAGAIIGIGWNSWNVMTAWGTRLRKDWVVQPITVWEGQYKWMTAQAALDAGAWSHLDMRVVGSDGNIMSGQDAKTYIETSSTISSYDWLSEDDKAFVDGLVNYKYSLPSRASKNYKQIMAAAAEKDPTFNAYEYTNRKSFANDWNKKRIAGWNLSKVATAVQHLEELERLWAELEGQSNLQIKNKLSGRAKENLGNPNITSFKQASAAVTSELAWAYKGTASPSEADREEWAELVWVELSPAQMEAYINWAAHLLFWKINTEALAYYDVMWKKPDSIFTQWWYNFLESKGLDIGNYFESPSIQGWTSHWDEWEGEQQAGSIDDR